MQIKARLQQLEKSKQRTVTEAECICFPPDEPPHLELKAEIEAARAVRCPLHGQRISKLAPTIYRVIAVPAHLDRACWSWHSPQYIKAMEASFPPDRFPATSIKEPDGVARFVLKDGTEIHRLPPPVMLYDYNTGQPCGWVDSHGRVLPLLPPMTLAKGVPAQKEAEVESLDY